MFLQNKMSDINKVVVELKKYNKTANYKKIVFHFYFIIWVPASQMWIQNEKYSSHQDIQKTQIRRVESDGFSAQKDNSYYRRHWWWVVLSA